MRPMEQETARAWGAPPPGEPAPAVPRRLYSIGHSRHTLEHFLGLLAAHQIAVLVDVRSQPYSWHAPQFNRQRLEPAVAAAGLRYVFLGWELGGRPAERDFYDAAGHVLYERVARAPRFADGLARVAAEAARARVALLCSEEDPAACHRRLLLGPVLARRGLPLDHIRGDGRLETEAALQCAEAGGQLPLLEPAQEAAWRSIRSVSPSGRRPSSSAR
jgi:uncharacterized protein (DUF488 family)